MYTICVFAGVGVLSCVFVALLRHVCVSMHASVQVPPLVNAAVCVERGNRGS